MHVATISPLSNHHATGHAAFVHAGRWLALDSDHAGVVDSDSLARRGELHELFEGAVIVSEWDDEEPRFDDLELDD